MKTALPLILLGSLLLVLAATASANGYQWADDAGFVNGCDFTFKCNFTNHDDWTTCDDELLSMSFNNAWSSNNDLTYSVFDPFQEYDHAEGTRSFEIKLKDVRGTGMITASCDVYLQDEWTDWIPCASHKNKTFTVQTSQVQIPSVCASGTSSPSTGANQAPVARFNYSPTSGIFTGTAVYFTDTSADADGAIASWNWNFGNGQTSTSKDANATYPAAGTYQVTLIVTDNAGAQSIVTRPVIVNSPAPPTPTTPTNSPPNASFAYSPASPVSVNTGVSFGDTSADSDGVIAFRTWTFLGATPSSSSSLNQTVLYPAPGTYTVILSVTDNNNATRTTTQTVTVTGTIAPPNPGNNQLPSADFNFAPVTSGKVNKGSMITFTDLSTDLDGNIAARTWTFSDDGSTSTGATTTHTFLKKGIHTVTLSVRDNNNGVSTASKTVNADRLSGSNSKPNANAGSDKKIDCGETTTLIGNGSDSDGVIVLYEWELEGADDYSSTTSGVYNVEYDNEGTYTAKLRVTDDEGATDTDAISIKVEKDDDVECDEFDDWTSSDDLNPVIVIGGGSTGTFTPQTSKPLGYSCNTGSECSSSVCTNNRCSQCESSGDCLNGNYCNAGSCYAKKLNGSECSSDSHCKTGYCNAGTCSNPFTGDLKGVGEPCAKDGECGTSHCAKAFGQSACVECVSSMDCAGSQKCSNYSCKDIDCQNGTIANRECVPFECSSDADCPSEKSCNESNHSCEDRATGASATASAAGSNPATGFASLAFTDEGRVNFGAGFLGLLMLAALTGLAAYSYMMRTW